MSSLIDECRAYIKRIDDHLHVDDCDMAHRDLHEFAHVFEKLIGGSGLVRDPDRAAVRP